MPSYSFHHGCLAALLRNPCLTFVTSLSASSIVTGSTTMFFSACGALYEKLAGLVWQAER